MKEITSQKKKLFKVIKNKVTAKDKSPLLLFHFTDFEQIFVSLVISYFFFLINY